MDLLMQFVYLTVILAIGTAILFARRKINGSKSFYKLFLVLIGMLLSFFAGNIFGITFDSVFLGSVSVFLLIVLAFELSTRMNPENIDFSKKSLILFFSMLLINTFIFTAVAVYILKIDVVSAIIFSILISSVEYFMVNELRKEGDFANPFIILFAFFILIFYDFSGVSIENIGIILQHLLIGLGMGMLFGIIVFKSMKNHKITWFHEIGLIAAALLVFLLTELIGGSGIFAVMILGAFFGNSHVREKIQLKSLSPFIYKSIEILFFLLIGFVVAVVFNFKLLLLSFSLFLIYLLLRFIIISFIYQHHSIHNKLLLTFAPKGMVFASMILVLGAYHLASSYMLSAMVYILIFSLFFSVIIEAIEQKKIKHLDKVFYVLRHLRFGRKKDLKRQ